MKETNMKNRTRIIACVAVALCVVSSATANVGALLKPLAKSEIRHAASAHAGKTVVKGVVKRGATGSASSALQKSLNAMSSPKKIMAAGVAGGIAIAANNVTSPEGGENKGSVGATVLRCGFASLPYVAVLLGGLFVAGVLRRVLKFAAGDLNRRGSGDERIEKNL